METIADMLEKRGYDRGYDTGYDTGYGTAYQEKPKWEKHAKVENSQEMLIKSLKMRFDLVKPNIKEQIRSIQDVDTLNDLFELSFKCSNIDEFTEILSQVTNN